MTTFCPRAVNCVSQTSFCLSQSLSTQLCPPGSGLWVSVCISPTGATAKPPIFLPRFPPRAKPVRVSNMVINRHNSHSQSPGPVTLTALWLSIIWFCFFIFKILASLSNWFESLRLQDGSWLDMSGHESYYLMGSGDASEEAVSCFPAGPIARMFSCFCSQF